MKTKAILLIASLFFAVTLSSFAGNPRADKVKVIKKNVSKKIDEAGQSGYNSILVVTDEEETKLDAAITLATETASQSYKTMVAIVNRDLEDNKELVGKYNLQRFTLPYVLIISANGSVMGGVVPGKVTAEQLAAYVPSACFNQVIESSKDFKPTYLLIASDDTETNNNWMKVMEESNSDAQLKADIIAIDPTDENEASFVARLGYRENMPLPILVVINKQGQVTSRFNSTPEASALTESATKVISKGCGSSCPSSKSCVGKKSDCGTK